MSSSPPQKRLEPSAVRLDGQDPYLRVLCVNIFVRDQDRSLRFYVDQLGFNLVIDESYEYDDASRLVRYANCGHYPGLLFLRDHTLERLNSTSTVLGLFPEW